MMGNQQVYLDLLHQFAEKVINFSSEYGTPESTSYVAANLAGQPKIYSNYGDFQEAFVLVSSQILWKDGINIEINF